MFYPGMRGGKTTLSFLIGAVCIILGGAPLLKLKFAAAIPILFSPTATKVALLIGGILLLYDGFQIKNPMTGIIKGWTIFTGLLMAVIGAIPLIVDLGWLNKSLPFIATLNIPIGILQGLLVVFGVWLIYDGLVLMKQFF